MSDRKGRRVLRGFDGRAASKSSCTRQTHRFDQSGRFAMTCKLDVMKLYAMYTASSFPRLQNHLIYHSDKGVAGKTFRGGDPFRRERNPQNLIFRANHNVF